MASRRLQLVLDLDTGGYTGRLVRAGAEMQRFSGNVDRTNKALAKSGKGFQDLGRLSKAPFDSLREGVLLFGNLRLAALALTGTIGALVGGMVKQSAEMERMTVLMKGLSEATTEAGRSAEAAKNMDQIFKMARSNAVAVKDLTDAFVKIKSGGMDPMKGSLENLTDAVSAFGGSSQVMHRASIAIQQMAGKGVISMEELRQQLGEAVPTAMKDMAAAMGMPLKEFTKLVGDGKVQAKPALELMFREFDRMYAGAGERMAETLTGQYQVFLTNLTHVSSLFTGQQRADIAEQTKLYEKGAISWAEYQAKLKPVEGGLFAQMTSAMKEINTALQSTEAKTAIMSLGQGMSDVASVMGSMARTAIEWRSEIWTGIKVVTGGFLFLKAVNIAGWFIQMGIAATTSLRGAAGATNFAGDAMTNLGTRLDKAAQSYRFMNHWHTNFIGLSRQSVAISGQKIAQLTQEHAGQQMLAADYARNIALLERQKLEQITQLNTARTLHQANIAMGRSTTGSLAAMSAAAANLNRTNRALTATQGQLAAATGRAASIKRQMEVVTRALNIAVARETALTGASTVALRAKAAAASLAAGAVTFLGRAVNFALGPIGMLAGVLLSAAWAAGVFESKADRAAAAAARLAQGIASLEDIKKVQADNDTRREENKVIEQRLGENLPAWQRKRLEAKKAANETTIKANDAKIEYGTSTLRDQGNRQFGDRVAARYRDNQAATDARYQDVRSRYDQGKASQAELDRAAQARDAAKKARYDTGIKGYRAKAAAARKAGNDGEAAKYDAAAEALENVTATSQDFTVASQDLRDASIGAGNAAAGQAGSTNKLTKAEREAAAAARENASDRNRYKDMIANQAGEIARLEEESIGAEGALAKFNAQLDAGKFGDATAEEIEKLRKGFAEIDKLNEKIAFNSAKAGLEKSLAKATAESDQLWKSLANGTWDADLRLAQTRAQFEHLLDGVTDPAKRAEIERLIGSLTQMRQRADAAEVVHGWEVATDEILISLMTEDEAREANYRREIDRQWKLIDWTKLSAAERAKAEQRFNELRSAMNQKYIRDSENGVVKMARDWANLGAGIDRAMTGALDGFVDSMAEGKFAFGDFVKSLLKDLLKVILRAMIAYAILSAIGATPTDSGGNKLGFGDFMKGQMRGWAGGFNPQVPQGTGAGPNGSFEPGGSAPDQKWGLNEWGFPRAQGGWIGSRMLKPGEVPMIGHEGEVVLNKQQQAYYASALNSAGGAMPSIEINMINNSGTAVKAEQGDTRMDAGKMIVDVVVDALGKQGPLRDGIQRLKG